ncbi:MAG: hypothetical protein K2N52_05765, partial [Clostridia bacterium]|nr:hypothetical protein [Clostridia bacterium]
MEKRVTQPRIGGCCALYSLKAQQAKKISLFTLIMLFFCTAILCCAFVMPKNTSLSSNALTSPAATVGELYNDSTKKFNKANLTDLAEKLLGSGKTTGDLMMAPLSGAIKASEFSTQDLQITFGGMEWTPVYLATSDDVVVLTLWLSENLGTSKFSNDSNNMYGVSYMRAVTLNNGGTYNLNLSGTATKSETNDFARFTMTKAELGASSSVISLTDYLLTPAQVKWQGEESAKAQNDGFDGYRDDQPNDSYLRDKALTNATMKTYQDEATYPLYDQWKDDYVWLPSLTEVGGIVNNGLWKPTTEQRKQSGDNCYLRTASYCVNSHVMLNTTSGTTTYTASTASAYGVRPCIHLNLSEILGGRVDDVETVYNGAPQTITTVDADQTIWYNSDIMTVTPLTTTMKDAGEYWLRADLKQDAIADGKEFLGDPDPTRVNGDESATRRYIKFTINKKPLKVRWMADSNGFPSVAFDDTNEIYGVDGSEGDATYPALGVVYYKKGSGINDAVSAPNSTGTWIARAVITNDCNYTTDPDSYEYEFDAKLQPVTQPIFTSTGTAAASASYNGQEQTITIDNVDTDKMTYTPDNNVVRHSINGSQLSIVVKAAKEYTVKFTLKTSDGLPYGWAGLSGDAATGQLSLTATVNKIALTVTAGDPVDNTDGSKTYSDWKWEVNMPVKVGLTTSAAATENLVFNVYYAVGAVSSHTTGVAATFANGNYVIPAIANKGTYTLCIELADSAADNVNGNYTFAGKYVSFEITGQNATLSSVDWKYKLGGTGNGTSITGTTANNVLTASLPYTGKEYSFFIDADSLPTGLGIKGYGGTKTATAVGASYSVTVTIQSTNPLVEFTDTTFTLNYEITKGEYNIDFAWVYNYTGDADDNVTEYDVKHPEINGIKTVTLKLMQRVNGRLVALPSELQVSYSGNTGRAVRNNYVASATITTTDANYNAPTVPNLTWEITEKQINVAWTWVTVYDDEGNEYETRQLLLDKPEYADLVEYYYYDENGDPVGEGINALKQLYDKTVAADGSKIFLTIKVEVRLKRDEVGSYILVDNSGKNCQEQFDIGDDKLAAKVEVEVSGVYSEATVNVKVSGEGMSSAYYTVEYWKAESITDLLEKVENFDPKTADAGKYVAVVNLVAPYDTIYILKPTRVLFEISPMEIAIPEIDEIIFSGYDFTLTEYLKGSYPLYKDIIEVVGENGISAAIGRNAGDYIAYLTLTNKNYIWAMPEEGGATATKYSLARATLAAEELSVSVDRSMLTLPWTINKAQLTANWNLNGKEGAVINALAAYKDAINEGLIDVELIIRYYDNDKNLLDTVEFAGGNSYLVDAILSGEDAGNFEFVNGVGSEKNATAMVEYSIKKSGLSAAMGAVKDFMTKTMMGLPLWVWLVIALVILLVLIIIIAVACKRRKSKEEREEAKARKEEERQRKEEERQRREEERQAQKERLETERELAKAKQEAELEKIRMQAGMAG